MTLGYMLIICQFITISTILLTFSCSLLLLLFVVSKKLMTSVTLHFVSGSLGYANLYNGLSGQQITSIGNFSLPQYHFSIMPMAKILYLEST